MTTTTSITTARELANRLLNKSTDVDKPILVDTGDGIYGINGVSEDSTEIVIYLGKMS